MEVADVIGGITRESVVKLVGQLPIIDDKDRRKKIAYLTAKESELFYIFLYLKNRCYQPSETISNLLRDILLSKVTGDLICSMIVHCGDLKNWNPQTLPMDYVKSGRFAGVGVYSKDKKLCWITTDDRGCLFYFSACMTSIHSEYMKIKGVD